MDAVRLTARDVGVSFGGLVALAGIDLDVGAGEIVGLIGSNGAGKSTMVNVLSGFQKPSRGTVFLGDVSLAGMAPHRISRAGVVRTFQSVRLFRDLTVAENIAAAVAVLGKGAPDIAELLALMGLSELKEKPAGSLSYAHQR